MRIRRSVHARAARLPALLATRSLFGENGSVASGSAKNWFPSPNRGRFSEFGRTVHVRSARPLLSYVPSRFGHAPAFARTVHVALRGSGGGTGLPDATSPRYATSPRREIRSSSALRKRSVALGQDRKFLEDAGDKLVHRLLYQIDGCIP